MNLGKEKQATLTYLTELGELSSKDFSKSSRSSNQVQKGDFISKIFKNAQKKNLQVWCLQMLVQNRKKPSSSKLKFVKAV